MVSQVGVDRLGHFLLSQGRMADGDQKDLLMSGRRNSPWLAPTQNAKSPCVPQLLRQHPHAGFVAKPPRRIRRARKRFRVQTQFQEAILLACFSTNEKTDAVFSPAMSAQISFARRWPDGQEVLNTFAYTCGYSVCAAKVARGNQPRSFRKYAQWESKTSLGTKSILRRTSSFMGMYWTGCNGSAEKAGNLRPSFWTLQFFQLPKFVVLSESREIIRHSLAQRCRCCNRMVFYSRQRLVQKFNQMNS